MDRQWNSVEFVNAKNSLSCPVYGVLENGLDQLALNDFARNWLRNTQFHAKAGDTVLIPDEKGGLSCALLGLGKNDDPFISAALVKALPDGHYHFEGALKNADLFMLGLALGGYTFSRYQKKHVKKQLTFALPDGVDGNELRRLQTSIFNTRDLINTPANEMTPQHLEDEARCLAKEFGATIAVTTGDDLLTKNFPLIHAVGRAGSVAPRLIDLHWGHEAVPKITLVGKGVCFDTGGLDIKSASGMLLMKKDMGGAANVLGLARLIMDAKLPIALRVLIPAVENAISGNAFRPGDVLKSRKGLSIEIGNTDAEGRLILADALAYGDEEKPDLMIDMATLTGAARVALGPDLPPFYTGHEAFADKVMKAADHCHDPLWRMPLWQPYMKKLSSRVADLNNVTSDGFAGSVTAALFLSRFVEDAKIWAHFDIYGWTPVEKPGFPVGGEAQGIRALFDVLKSEYGQ